MKKLSMLAIIVGAALLTATPLSLPWSQKNVALSLEQCRCLSRTTANGDERCRRSPKGSSKGISPRTLLLLLAAGPVRALGQLAICAVLDPYTRCRWQALARLCESGGSPAVSCRCIRFRRAQRRGL